MEPQPTSPSFIPASQITQTAPSAPMQPTIPVPPRPEPNEMHRISEKIAQIFGLIYFFVASVLLLRFVFSLFAADRSTPFAGFVYAITTPFMFLFENMFGGPVGVGEYQLESEIFVALIVYALIFFGLARLIKILFK